MIRIVLLWMFFFNDTATTEIYTYCHTLSLHDALPIYAAEVADVTRESAKYGVTSTFGGIDIARSEEHTSELQSLMRNSYAVFCLKKKNNYCHTTRNLSI